MCIIYCYAIQPKICVDFWPETDLQLTHWQDSIAFNQIKNGKKYYLKDKSLFGQYHKMRAGIECVQSSIEIFYPSNNTRGHWNNVFSL